jgi:hypothetical protein
MVGSLWKNELEKGFVRKFEVEHFTKETEKIMKIISNIAGLRAEI